MLGLAHEVRRLRYLLLTARLSLHVTVITAPGSIMILWTLAALALTQVRLVSRYGVLCMPAACPCAHCANAGVDRCSSAWHAMAVTPSVPALDCIRARNIHHCFIVRYASSRGRILELLGQVRQYQAGCVYVEVPQCACACVCRTPPKVGPNSHLNRPPILAVPHFSQCCPYVVGCCHVHCISHVRLPT